MSDKTLDEQVQELIDSTGQKQETQQTPKTPNLFSLDMGFKTPPVYSGAELKASELAAGQILPEDTATARASATAARIYGTPAEMQRDAAQGAMPSIEELAAAPDVEKRMTTDFLGFNREQRQRLDTLGDDYVLGVDEKGNDITVMRLRMGRYFQRSILESLIRFKTGKGEKRYQPNKQEIAQATAEARLLSTEFPDDPKYTRALTDLYASAKLMVVDLPLHAAASTSYLGQEIIGKGVPRVAGYLTNIIRGMAALGDSKWAERMTEKEFSNFIKWNVDAAENFYSGKWGAVEGFNLEGITNAKVRPFVYNAFFSNDLELTPQTAAMVFNIDNPGAGFMSHLLHLSATAAGPTVTIGLARNMLMRGVGKRFKEFAANPNLHSARLNAKGESQAINLDIVKGKGAVNANEIKVLTREFLEYEARNAKVFRGEGKVRSILDNIKTGRIELSQRQTIQADLVALEKLSRKDPAAASLGGKTLTDTLKDRMKKAQAKQEKAYTSPTSTLQARKEADDEVRDIAFEQNLVGMGYGRGLQPTVRLFRNPQLRDEAKVEAAFSFGSTMYQQLMKTERADRTGYKSAPWYFDMASGFLSAMTLRNVVPARIAQASSFAREFAMNAEVMLRNKGLLARIIEGTDIAGKRLSPEEEAKRLGTIRVQAMNHWFSPQAQLRLDMAGGPNILREADVRLELEGKTKGVPSRLRRGVARMTPEVVKTPYLTNRALRYSHIDKDGDWVKLKPEEQDALLNIADSIILSGKRVEILEVTKESIEMDQAIRDLGGDPRKFNTLLSHVLPMLGLMVFEETSDKSISSVFGGLRVRKLAEAINQISAHSDFLKEVDVVINNLFPEGVNPAARSQLVGEIVASTKAMAGLYRNKIVTDIRNAITELKQIQAASNKNPGDFIVKGEPVDGMFSRIDDVNQKITELEKQIKALEKDVGVLPDAPGMVAGRQAAGEAIVSGEKVSADADDLDVAFADLGEKVKQVRTTEEQAVAAMPGVSYTNGVDISLEVGDIGSAILDLALRTQRAYRLNYKKLYDDFFDALDKDPDAVQAIDDIGFVERLMASYYTRVTGKPIEGESAIDAIARGMKDNRTGSVELRKFFSLIEKASREEFQRIYDGLDLRRQEQINKLLSDPSSNRTMQETMEALKDSGFNVENGLNNYLALNVVLGEKLPWTFRTLNDFRLQANSLGHSLNDGSLRDIAEQMRIAMAKAMGEENSARFDDINEGYRVDIGDRFDRSELGGIIARSVHLMGKEGEDVARQLEEYFDLNKKLFGTDQDANAFSDEIKKYFGAVIEAARRPRELSGPVRTRFGLNLNTKITNETDGSVVNIGEDLQKIIATLHHSALLKSKVFKGIDYDIEGWTTNRDVRARLIKHISGYDDNAAASIESGTRIKLFSDERGENSILAGLGDMEYQASLLKLVEDSKALRGQLDSFMQSVNSMTQGMNNRLNSIEELARKIVNATVEDDIAKSPIRTTVDFFNALNRGIDDIAAGSLEDYIGNLARQMGVDEPQIKQSLFSLFMQHAANHARGAVETIQGQAKVLDDQRLIDSFNPEAMEQLFEQNKNLLDVIIPDGGVTVNKLNAEGVMEPIRLTREDYMQELMKFARLLRVYAEGQGVTAPKNIHAHAVKSLSPSSIISRIYAVNRGVVSSKYVITEAGIIYFRKKKAGEMAAILQNPDLMYHMNKILETRNVLPQAENKAFVGALKRGIIHAERIMGEQVDPTEDTFVDKVKRQQQTEAKKLTLEDDYRMGMPYVYPENYDRVIAR